MDTAQKEPNPAKSDADATGTTLEEQTGKNMERRRKASYRDSESGVIVTQNLSNIRKGKRSRTQKVARLYTEPVQHSAMGHVSTPVT